MRKTAPMTFGQLWNEFLESTPNVARKLAEARVAEIWPSVVGPMVAHFTESVSVNKGVLYVKITSAAARSEIFMRREELKNSLNKGVGSQVIKTVIVK